MDTLNKVCNYGHMATEFKVGVSYPGIQEEAMKAYEKHNKKRIKLGFTSFAVFARTAMDTFPDKL